MIKNNMLLMIFYRDAGLAGAGVKKSPGAIFGVAPATTRRVAAMDGKPQKSGKSLPLAAKAGLSEEK